MHDLENMLRSVMELEKKTGIFTISTLDNEIWSRLKHLFIAAAAVHYDQWIAQLAFHVEPRLTKTRRILKSS